MSLPRRASLGIDRFVLVGYSMGSQVAQLVWRRHPELVQGLVLCAASRNFKGKPGERLFFTALPAVIGAVQLMLPAPPAAVRQQADAFEAEPGPTVRRLPGWAWEEFQRTRPVGPLQGALRHRQLQLARLGGRDRRAHRRGRDDARPRCATDRVRSSSPSPSPAPPSIRSTPVMPRACSARSDSCPCSSRRAHRWPAGSPSTPDRLLRHGSRRARGARPWTTQTAYRTAWATCGSIGP